MFVVLFLVSSFLHFFSVPALIHLIVYFSTSNYVFIIFWSVFTPLKAYPETKGVPLEEMDIVFGEGIYRFLSHIFRQLINFLLSSHHDRRREYAC